MKNLIATMAVAAAMFALPGVAGAQAATVLRMGFATELSGPGGAGVQKMAEIIKDRSHGELELKIFPNSQLGSEQDMLTQVQTGNLDAAMLGTGIVSALEPSLELLDLPFIWKSPDSFWTVLNGPIGDKLLDNLTAKGLQGLAWGTWGARGLINSGYAINSPADLKGKRIRVAAWAAA